VLAGERDRGFAEALWLRRRVQSHGSCVPGCAYMLAGGEPFDGALMAQGDGTHRLPIKAKLRKAIGKGAGDTVHVRIDERIG
jgi:hypothetical protein